jgi:hypothetical protein
MSAEKRYDLGAVSAGVGFAFETVHVNVCALRGRECLFKPAQILDMIA